MIINATFNWGMMTTPHSCLKWPLEEIYNLIFEHLTYSAILVPNWTTWQKYFSSAYFFTEMIHPFWCGEEDASLDWQWAATVSLQWLQPKLDCKRSFIAESFLRHSYIDILITAKIFHRAVFEKTCLLEAENSVFRMHKFMVNMLAFKACRLSYVTLMCKMIPVVIIIF